MFIFEYNPRYIDKPVATDNRNLQAALSLCRVNVILCRSEKYNDADMLVIASYSKTIGYYVSVAAPSYCILRIECTTTVQHFLHALVGYF